MPIPPSVSTGIVTGTFVSTNGNPATGRIWFTPSFDSGIVAGDNVIVLPERQIVSLNTLGSFSVTLVATDDPDLDPLNFTYTVTFDIDRAKLAPLSLSLPSGTTVDLADVLVAL